MEIWRETPLARAFLATESAFSLIFMALLLGSSALDARLRP